MKNASKEPTNALPQLPVVVDETFVEYDRSQLFTCADQMGNLFLAMSVDEDDNCEHLILTSINANQVQLLKENVFPLATAFNAQDRENKLYQLTVFKDGSNPAIKNADLDSVEEMLNLDEDVYLTPDDSCQ